MLTLGSLFDGSGGFPLAGLLNGIKPLWASEIEPFAIRVTTKRLPGMKHLGSVTEIDGGKIEPVDIITFGSPCQDLSVAGQRAGLELEGGRSNLFYEAIRIIKEMRTASGERYPTFAVWENVPGAFSSNKGADFRSVLEAFCKIKDETAYVPQPKKWEPAGEILGDDCSVAWRVLDAQFWGVPQRRKRIFLVADFNGERAGKILFESKGVSGNPESCQGERQGTAQGAERGFGAAGDVAQEHGHQPCVLFENHAQDSRYTGPLRVAPTVATYYGAGGNNQPLVYKMGHGDYLAGVNTDVAASLAATDYYATSEIAATLRRSSVPCVDGEALMCYGICAKDSNSMKSSNPHSGIYEATTARTLDLNGGNRNCNQGGMAICVQGSMIGRADKNGPNGSGVNEEVSFTLNATDRHAVTQYAVRRLAPRECARLQGFPDWWCDGLETENPTETELQFWVQVFKTAGSKRTHNQIIKWLKNPYSDSAEYKLWGNGIALPCASYVLGSIAYWAKEVL